MEAFDFNFVNCLTDLEGLSLVDLEFFKYWDCQDQKGRLFFDSVTFLTNHYFHF